VSFAVSRMLCKFTKNPRLSPRIWTMFRALGSNVDKMKSIEYVLSHLPSLTPLGNLFFLKNDVWTLEYETSYTWIIQWINVSGLYLNQI
jgi:hypothetical protein